MKLTLKIAVLCTLSLNGFAQTTQDSLLQTLVKNEQNLVDAIASGDKKLWNEFLHDSCIISIEDGTSISKQKFVEDINPLPAGYVGRIQVIEPKLQVYANTVAMSFVNDEYLELFNQKIHTQYRQTDTWINIDGKWKVIAMQLFEIPKNPPPAKVDSAILKLYTGTYALSPERTCNVYVENGRLYTKKVNKEPQELFAETENFFFRKGDGRVNVIFIKTGDGNYKMVERREGEDLVWQKLKP